MLKNQAMAISHNFESMPFGQPGSPLLGPQPFNPIQRGKLFRGSVAAKNKLFSDNYKVDELIVIIFSFIFFLFNNIFLTLFRELLRIKMI